jgi:hypothetical protein
VDIIRLVMTRLVMNEENYETMPNIAERIGSCEVISVLFGFVNYQ